MSSESYRNRLFTINDADARIRNGSDLLTFVTNADGTPKRIANGTKISVLNARTIAAGAKAVSIFVEAATASGDPIGWTSANNLAGRFLSETLGEIPPANNSQHGPNAAWSNGAFLKQITLVRVAGTRGEIEHIAKASCAPFLALVAAARDDGRTIGVNSAFRTFAEQKALHDGFIRKLPGFNLASRPGNSNHQSGIAFDFDVKPGDGNPNYEWLKKHATAHGFIRTVKSEPWHWEFRPTEAQAARQRGVFGTFM